MFYIWDFLTNLNTKFFKCGLEIFEGSSRIPWNSGIKFESDKLPKLLQYKAANNLPPEDYVLTSGPQFLVSERIVNILKTLNPEGIDYYDSEIIRPSGEVLNGFSTLNITDVVDCMDKEKSKYRYEEFGPAKVTMFDELRLDHEKIPDNIKVFRLFDARTLVIVNQEIKHAFESESIIGIKFIPVEEYVDI
jgi:hypothetical protein